MEMGSSSRESSAAMEPRQLKDFVDEMEVQRFLLSNPVAAQIADDLQDHYVQTIEVEVWKRTVNGVTQSFPAMIFTLDNLDKLLEVNEDVRQAVQHRTEHGSTNNPAISNGINGIQQPTPQASQAHPKTEKKRKRQEEKEAEEAQGRKERIWAKLQAAASLPNKGGGTVTEGELLDTRTRSEEETRREADGTGGENKGVPPPLKTSQLVHSQTALICATPSAMDVDPIEVQEKHMREARELAIKKREEEEAEAEAARMERVRNKAESMGLRLHTSKTDGRREALHKQIDTPTSQTLTLTALNRADMDKLPEISAYKDELRRESEKQLQIQIGCLKSQWSAEITTSLNAEERPKVKAYKEQLRKEVEDKLLLDIQAYKEKVQNEANEALQKHIENFNIRHALSNALESGELPWVKAYKEQLRKECYKDFEERHKSQTLGSTATHQEIEAFKRKLGKDLAAGKAKHQKDSILREAKKTVKNHINFLEQSLERFKAEEQEKFDKLVDENFDVFHITVDGKDRNAKLTKSAVVKLYGKAGRVQSQYQQLCAQALREYKEDLKGQCQKHLADIELECRAVIKRNFEGQTKIKVEKSLDAVIASAKQGGFKYRRLPIHFDEPTRNGPTEDVLKEEIREISRAFEPHLNMSKATKKLVKDLRQPLSIAGFSLVFDQEAENNQTLTSQTDRVSGTASNDSVMPEDSSTGPLLDARDKPKLKNSFGNKDTNSHTPNQKASQSIQPAHASIMDPSFPEKQSVQALENRGRKVSSVSMRFDRPAPAVRTNPSPPPTTVAPTMRPRPPLNDIPYIESLLEHSSTPLNAPSLTSAKNWYTQYVPLKTAAPVSFPSNFSNEVDQNGFNYTESMDVDNPDGGVEPAETSRNNRSSAMVPEEQREGAKSGEVNVAQQTAARDINMAAAPMGLRNQRGGVHLMQHGATAPRPRVVDPPRGRSLVREPEGSSIRATNPNVAVLCQLPAKLQDQSPQSQVRNRGQKHDNESRHPQRSREPQLLTVRFENGLIAPHSSLSQRVKDMQERGDQVDVVDLLPRGPIRSVDVLPYIALVNAIKTLNAANPDVDLSQLPSEGDLAKLRLRASCDGRNIWPVAPANKAARGVKEDAPSARQHSQFRVENHDQHPRLEVPEQKQHPPPFLTTMDNDLFASKPLHFTNPQLGPAEASKQSKAKPIPQVLSPDRSSDTMEEVSGKSTGSFSTVELQEKHVQQHEGDRSNEEIVASQPPGAAPPICKDYAEDSSQDQPSDSLTPKSKGRKEPKQKHEKSKSGLSRRERAKFMEKCQEQAAQASLQPRIKDESDFMLEDQLVGRSISEILGARKRKRDLEDNGEPESLTRTGNSANGAGQSNGNRVNQQNSPPNAIEIQRSVKLPPIGASLPAVSTMFPPALEVPSVAPSILSSTMIPLPPGVSSDSAYMSTASTMLLPPPRSVSTGASMAEKVQSLARAISTTNKPSKSHARSTYFARLGKFSAGYTDGNGSGDAEISGYGRGKDESRGSENKDDSVIEEDATTGGGRAQETTRFGVPEGEDVAEEYVADIVADAEEQVRELSGGGDAEEANGDAASNTHHGVSESGTEH